MFHIIAHHLIENYAYSLVSFQLQGIGGCALRFREVYSLDSLRRECVDNGFVELGDGKLSALITEVRSLISSPVSGFMRMQGLWENKQFFIGEVIRLNHCNRQIAEMIKVDKDRWLVTSASHDVFTAAGTFVSFDGSVGANTASVITDIQSEIESVDYIIPTSIHRLLDAVIFPSYYHKCVNEDYSLEKSLIIPLYEQLRDEDHKKELTFETWRNLIADAYENGMNMNTILHVTTAVFSHFKALYKWN